MGLISECYACYRCDIEIEKNKKLKEALTIAADQFTGLALSLEKHGVDIDPNILIDHLKQSAERARRARDGECVECKECKKCPK